MNRFFVIAASLLTFIPIIEAIEDEILVQIDATVPQYLVIAAGTATAESLA